VLGDAAITRDKATLRAVALQILGEAYMGAKKEEAGSPTKAAGEDADYVKIDTKASRSRESRGQSQSGQFQQQPAPGDYPHHRYPGGGP